MIPITDIEDPRLNLRWTEDTHSVADAEAFIVQAPKRVAALLQAMREKLDIVQREAVLSRAREIVNEPH